MRKPKSVYVHLEEHKEPEIGDPLTKYRAIVQAGGVVPLFKQYKKSDNWVKYVPAGSEARRILREFEQVDSDPEHLIYFIKHMIKESKS